jgi:hypothetical protein
MSVWFFFHNFNIEDYQYPKGSEWQRGLLEATFRFSSTRHIKKWAVRCSLTVHYFLLPLVALDRDGAINAHLSICRKRYRAF